LDFFVRSVERRIYSEFIEREKMIDRNLYERKEFFLHPPKRIYKITPKAHISTGFPYGTLFMISGAYCFKENERK
jgi:hypothetical protein